MIDNKPLISIIVPIYNVEKYLCKCVDSILAQTYENIEIILVDDGSPDNCPAMCDEYAKKYDNIKVLHKKNGGLSDARNEGIKIAKGEYIGFVDSDDYIHPQMYEKLYNALADNDSDVSICSCYRVDENGEIISQYSPLKNEFLTSTQAFAKLNEYASNYYATACYKLYKKHIFDDISFPVGKLNEDQGIVHLVFWKSKKIATISDRLYYHYKRTGSIMQSRSVRSYDEVEMFYRRIEFYREHKLYQFIPGMCEYMRNRFYIYNKTVKAITTEEKKRVSEIKEMVDKAHNDNADILGKGFVLEYRYPISKIILVPKRKIHALLRGLKMLVRAISKDFCIIDTPRHGNLGDHAIALAEYQFIYEKVDGKACDFTGLATMKYARFFDKYISKDTVFLINGGGSLGYLWPHNEYRLREFLKQFKNRKIIIMPQTVTFDMNTTVGRAFFEDSKEAYESHPDLTIFVREAQSFEFMKEHMPKVNCILVPDIVTSLQYTQLNAEKSGAVFCLRADHEKVLSDDNFKFIEDTVKEKIGTENLVYSDNVMKYKISRKDREKEVNAQLDRFAKAKLVVTDRLHGMVFAAIAGTPCIAFSNSNGKVKMVYEWIKDLPYVKFLDSVEELPEAIDSIDLNKEYKYDYTLADKHFKPLEEVLKNIK